MKNLVEAECKNGSFENLNVFRNESMATIVYFKDILRTECSLIFLINIAYVACVMLALRSGLITMKRYIYVISRSASDCVAAALFVAGTTIYGSNMALGNSLLYLSAIFILNSQMTYLSLTLLFFCAVRRPIKYHLLRKRWLVAGVVGNYAVSMGVLLCAYVVVNARSYRLFWVVFCSAICIGIIGVLYVVDCILYSITYHTVRQRLYGAARRRLTSSSPAATRSGSETSSDSCSISTTTTRSKSSLCSSSSDQIIDDGQNHQTDNDNNFIQKTRVCVLVVQHVTGSILNLLFVGLIFYAFTVFVTIKSEGFTLDCYLVTTARFREWITEISGLCICGFFARSLTDPAFEFIMDIELNRFAADGFRTVYTAVRRR